MAFMMYCSDQNGPIKIVDPLQRVGSWDTGGVSTCFLRRCQFPTPAHTPLGTVYLFAASVENFELYPISLAPIRFLHL